MSRTRFGERLVSTANCSSSGLRSRSRASPSTWSNDGSRPVRHGEPSCVIMLQTLPPWTCLLSRTLVSICSMPSLLCGSIVGTSRGSAPQATRQQSGLHVRYPRPFPWDVAPGYMIRDRDRIYGTVVTRRLRAMGIRDKPIAPASPWQNGVVERLIGSIRRECVDHIIVLGEAHLRRILKSYARYYNRASEHPSVYVVEEKRLC